MNDPALLFLSESGDPDRDQAILAERQAEAWVGRDLQEKVTVTPEVSELVFGGLAQWQPAENERPPEEVLREVRERRARRTTSSSAAI